MALPRDNFRSYVRYEEQPSDHLETEGVSPTSFDMLTDEIVASQCDNVLLYPPFNDNLFGKLYCTNFRLCFIPLAEVTENGPCCSRSAILADRFQLALCSIAEIQISALPMGSRWRESAKFKPMTAPVSTLEIISGLKLFTKDFRTWTIDFQKSQFAVNLANQIFHFANPANPAQIVQMGQMNPGPRFNGKMDWDRELHRCGVVPDRGWRLSYVNSDQYQRFRLIPSYPECVVVPIDLFDHHLGSFICNWNLSRFPIWCWTGKNGCALLRSADSHSDSRAGGDLWEMVIEAVARCHPDNRRPEFVDCQSDLHRLSTAFTSLRQLCCIDSLNAFLELDREWLSAVDSTGWIQLVNEALNLTAQAVNTIVFRKRSIIVREADGCDMAPLVSSLCQICCDKYYRTIEGLETLIEKEWIALGHPFGSRLFNTPIESPQSITDSMSETTPTFLLFLDCLAQLLRLNPGQFEYSQYYLITLWDLAISGLTSAFSSNCIRDQLTLGKDDRPFPLNRFFSTKYAQLFFDAAFSTAQILGLLAENNITSPVIFPPECPIAVVFWEECYLRWLQPAHTLNGGAIVRDMAMRDIETELAALAGKRLGHLTIRASRHPAADQDRFSSAFPFSQPGAVDYPVRSFRKSDLIFSQQHHPPSITSRSLFAAPVHEVPEPYLEDGATLIEESQEARYQRLRSRPLPAVPMIRPIDANLFPPLDASPPRNNSVWGTLV